MIATHVPVRYRPHPVPLARGRAIPGFGLLALAAGMAVAMLLGPLGFGVVSFAVSESAETQLLGGEVATMFLAIPLATVAGVLWLRGARLAPVLACGPGIYAAYMYAQYALAPDFTRYEGNSQRAFPLYLLLVLGGWLIAAHSWVALARLDLPAPGARLGMITGALLFILNLLFALAWIASIVPVVAGNEPGSAYLADPTLFWMVRLMDLGFVIPLGIATALVLLRRLPIRARLLYAWHGAQTLLVSAVCGMAWMMEVRNDPEADPVFLVATTLVSVAFIAIGSMLWRAARRATGIDTIS